MTALDVLLGVRDLLSDESRWSKGFLATTSDNFPVNPLSVLAAKWCLEGALRKTIGIHNVFDFQGRCLGGDRLYDEVSVLLLMESSRVYSLSYIGLNDAVGYEAVLGLLDRLIADLRNKLRENVAVEDAQKEVVLA